MQAITDRGRDAHRHAGTGSEARAGAGAGIGIGIGRVFAARKWIASALLAVGAVAAAAACAPAAERGTAKVSAAPAASKPSAKAQSSLIQQALPNVKGRTFTSRIVEFPPGGHAAPHRHGEAFVYAYVLDGTVRSKLEGEPVRTYHQGENWVEQPGAHHVTTHNTSRTKPARLLVVFISHTGDELKVDDPPKQASESGH